jgi:hypothetical protein
MTKKNSRQTARTDIRISALAFIERNGDGKVARDV